MLVHSQKSNVNTESFDKYDISSSVVTTVLEPMCSKEILNKYFSYSVWFYVTVSNTWKRKPPWRNRLLLTYCYRGLSPQSLESVSGTMVIEAKRWREAGRDPRTRYSDILLLALPDLEFLHHLPIMKTDF